MPSGAQEVHQSQKKNLNDASASLEFSQATDSGRMSAPATPQRPQPSRYACAICMENEAIEAVVTACGHLYCWSCLYRWLDAGHSRCPVCSARVNKSDVTPLYASELRGRPPSPVPRPRSRTPSPVARSSPRQWDSPERTPPRSTSLPPPLPSLVDGRAANAAFPSLFGLQFRRLLWRRRAGPEDFGLQLWSMGLLVAVLALVFVA